MFDLSLKDFTFKDDGNYFHFLLCCQCSLFELPFSFGVLCSGLNTSTSFGNTQCSNNDDLAISRSFSEFNYQNLITFFNFIILSSSAIFCRKFWPGMFEMFLTSKSQRFRFYLVSDKT